VGPIPEDLIVFLLFAAFVLVQILRNWRRGKRRTTRAEPAPAAPAETPTQAEAGAEAPLQQPWTPTLVEGPRPKPALQDRPAQASTWQPKRRFSPRALKGDRRALRDAIVVATLLGPCRAQRPREME
jgi:hypothetical protein